MLSDKEREGKRLDFSTADDLTEVAIEKLQSISALKAMHDEFNSSKPVKSKALYIKALLVQARRAQPPALHTIPARQPAACARVLSACASVTLPSPRAPRPAPART